MLVLKLNTRTEFEYLGVEKRGFLVSKSPTYNLMCGFLRFLAYKKNMKYSIEKMGQIVFSRNVEFVRSLVILNV